MKQNKLRSLRRIVIIGGGIVLVLFVLVFFLIVQSSMSKLLLQTEERYLAEQLNTLDTFFTDSKINMALVADSAAKWDEVSLLLRGEDVNSIETLWRESGSYELHPFNFFRVQDDRGTVRHAQFYDHMTETSSLPEGLEEALSSLSAEIVTDGKWRASGKMQGESGILFHDGQPYLVAVAPVVRDGELLGTVSLGSLLTNEYFQQLALFGDPWFSFSYQHDTMGSVDAHLYSGDEVHALLPLIDIYGRPITLTMVSDRPLYAMGEAVIGRATAFLIVAVLLFVSVLYWVMARYIMNPIEKLSNDMESIGTASLEQRINVRDYPQIEEFHTLCRSTNGMLDRISQSQVSLRVLQSILNGMDSLVYVSDLETDEILFINKQMAAQFGKEPAEVIGKPCYELLGLSSPCADCNTPALCRDPESIITWEHLSPVNGRYYQKIDSVIEWGSGKMAHLQHSVDIHRMKEAEAALEKRLKQQELMTSMSRSFMSSEDLSALVENALDMTGEFLDASKIVIIAADMERQTVRRRHGWFNKKHGIEKIGQVDEQFFGPGQALFDTLVAEKRPYVLCEDINRYPAFGYLKQFDVKSFIAVPVFMREKFWGAIVVDDCVSFRSWEDSDVYLLQLISNVISELVSRWETQEELLRMSSIVDSSPLCIAYFAKGGDLVYANQGLVDVCGYSLEELLERRTLFFLLEDVPEEKIKENSRKLLAGGGEHTFEAVMRCKDDSRRNLLLTLFRTGRDRRGIGVIASDITEKIALERDLVVAKEQAERSSQAKGDFLSRMSHEMRTPMNAIIGMTSIAQSSGEVEQKDYCLEKISSASVHLLGVINDILDMSKIESGKFELSPTEFSFEKMLMRVTTVVNFRVDEKHLQFGIKVDNDFPHALVTDEQRLAQVVTNLLSNAVKFTPENGIITLYARKLDEDAAGMCTLQIEVEDSGIGIPKEQQSKLFNSFEQLDGGVSRRFGGTGLGLAISKKIVELMDGEIWVESELGKGARFLFNIRAARGAADAPPLPDVEVNWKNLRILAVDDSVDVLEYFLNLSNILGFSCAVAQSGEDACREMEKNSAFNVIFVDWQMPGMNGIELTRRIKKKYGKNAVVIMISAVEWATIEEEASAAGVDRFISKPLFASAIADCVVECLQLRQGRPELEEERTIREMQDLFKGRRILLAEDIEINREVLIALLEPSGLVIDCAVNGDEAFRMFRDSPGLYDMIFMDIHMPEVDGYESTRMIRGLGTPEAESIPIVAMTANVFREDVERCLAAGMDGHVGKPLDLDEVVRILQKYLLAR